MLRYAPHAIGVFRSCRRGNGLLPHPAGGGTPVAARLRHDSGRPRCAGAQSTAVSVRSHHHRRGGPEPCAHRSLRPPAAAGQARISRAYLHEQGVRGPGSDPAARFGEPCHARRGARAGPVAVRSRGRRDYSAPAATHRLRHAARAAAGSHRAGPRRGTHPGLLERRGVGERGRGAAQTGVLRRSRPVRHADPPGSFRV